MTLSEMDENLRNIKKAGIKEIGEVLPMKAPSKKKEKKTSYASKTKWFRLKR